MNPFLQSMNVLVTNFIEMFSQQNYNSAFVQLQKIKVALFICSLDTGVFDFLQGNVIYNIIPDIISSLSDPKSGVDEEIFQTVMR